MRVFGDMWDYLSDGANWSGGDGIAALLGQQLLLTLTALAMAMLVGLPIALWLGHLGRGGFLAINISNVGRAIPTFALLALPVVMAGLRVATVSTVALTTVGSLVAYGGLGNLIKDGVLTNFRAELFTASLLCVVLAFVLDVVLVGAQRVMTPWTRGVRT